MCVSYLLLLLLLLLPQVDMCILKMGAWRGRYLNLLLFLMATLDLCLSNRDTVSLDLRSGVVRGFSPHIKFISTPASTPNVSAHLLSDADWCGREAVLEVTVEPGDFPTILLDLEYSSPRLWTLHIADSLNATGYQGGPYSEAHINNRQWRVYGRGPELLENSLDGTRLLALTDGVIQRYYHFRIYLSHHDLEWRYGRQFGGRRGSLEGPALFKMSGEVEEKGGGKQRAENRIYIGLNRIIGGRWRQGSGLCHVTITLVNDVCRSGRHRCDSHAVCKSFKKFHRCSCRDGWEGNGRTCTDVDECRLRNGGCVHICTNSPGNYSCSCHLGFEPHPLDHHNCQDVDECATDNGGCQHTCANTIGSFTCSCWQGFTLSADGRSCIASDTCVSLDCEQHCLVGAGGAPSCGCREGYVLVRATRCQPTCSVGNGGCQHHCHQTTNGPACTCHSKYLLAADGQSCVPSCAINNGGCEKRCHNTATGVRCSCPQGFALHEDQRSCLDQDECQAVNGGCEHICINNYGSYECVCPPGYKLNQDERSCRDVDECAVDYTCQHLCTNTPGSYRCSCLEGYELFAGAHCSDRNECSIDNGGCEHGCTNTEGSSFCTCNAGYRLHPNGRDCLQNEKCTPLRNPTKAEVSCYHLEDYEYEERCTVRCEAGSSFITGPSDYYVYTCGSNTKYEWRPALNGDSQDLKTTSTRVLNSTLLACSEDSVIPGYKRLAMLQLKTNINENGNKTETFTQDLINILTEKMSYCGDICQLRLISEKIISSPRRTQGSDSSNDLAEVRTKFEVVAFPSPTNRRCRRKCLRRFGRQLLKGAVLSISKALAERQVFESSSGQRYEVVPKTFKPRRRMKEACPNGYVYVNKKCVACSLGSFYDIVSDSCVVCPAGTYQSKEGAMKCLSCPSSISTSGPFKAGARDLSECSDACPAGYWSADGFSPCHPCAPGTYQGHRGRVKCFPCPGGRSSPLASTSFSQCLSSYEVCIQGEFWNSSEGSCQDCGVGYYQPNLGAASCIQCPANTTTDSTRSTSIDDCKRLECGGEVGELGGYFESPNYPGNYPNDARCTWTVKPGNGRRVLVVVPEIHLSSDQCGDYLVLRKSKSAYSPVTFEACSSIDRPIVFTSRSRRLWVRFKSDHNGTASGFRIQFVTYNEEYHRLIESIVRDNRLYSLQNHLDILRDRELLPKLLEVVAEPIKYYQYAKEKDKLFPSSFIRLLTPKVRRFFTYRRRRK